MAGLWQVPPLDVLTQTQVLDQIVIGQDWYIVFGPVAVGQDASTFTISFTLFPPKSSAITVSATGDAITGNINVSPILHNQTSVLQPAVNGVPFRLVRTDSPHIEILAEGSVAIVYANGGGVIPP